MFSFTAPKIRNEEGKEDYIFLFEMMQMLID